jgi:hypothetical protein
MITLSDQALILYEGIDGFTVRRWIKQMEELQAL